MRTVALDQLSDAAARWEDKRVLPLGDGRCAKVVIADGSKDYTPQARVYVVRAMRAPEGFDDDLDEELELLAEEWSSDRPAEDLCVRWTRIGSFENFGLGEDRS